MKLELTIPTDLSEIKLSQYQKFIKIAKNNEDSEFLRQKMVQIFCNIDLKDVATIRYREVNEITTKMFAEFTKTHELTRTFKLNGIEFGFIPNLDDLKTGEYVDLDTYFMDWDEMNKAMAVLYRPIKEKQGDKYLIQDYVGSSKYAETMKDMPLDVALGAYVFFYHLGKELLISTLTFLEENPQVQNILSKHNLGKDGVGTHQFMPSLKETLEDLMKLPNYPFIKV
jgi:hypothetical protein